jgi:hypothetical protein
MKKIFPIKANLIIDSLRNDLSNIIIISETENQYICIVDTKSKNKETFKVRKGRVVFKSNNN